LAVRGMMSLCYCIVEILAIRTLVQRKMSLSGGVDSNAR